MDLNNISLTDDLLQELYGAHLVTTDAAPESAPEAAPQTAANQPAATQKVAIPPVKGGMGKGVLWLVQEPNAAFLNDADFEMLTKVLQACKLTWADAGLLNIHPGGMPVATLAQQLQPRYLICCGIDAQLLGEAPPLYQTLEAFGCDVLVTDALSQIGASKEKKVLLWNALKQMLHIQ